MNIVGVPPEHRLLFAPLVMVEQRATQQRKQNAHAKEAVTVPKVVATSETPALPSQCSSDARSCIGVSDEPDGSGAVFMSGTAAAAARYRGTTRGRGIERGLHFESINAQNDSAVDDEY
jgi:hypothetical protein